MLGDIILSSVASSEEFMFFLEYRHFVESNVSQSQAPPGFCGALPEGKWVERSLIDSPAQRPPSAAARSQLLAPAARPRTPPGCRQSRGLSPDSLAAWEGSQKVETLHRSQIPKPLAGARQLPGGWRGRPGALTRHSNVLRSGVKKGRHTQRDNI